jgi:hypothetical protein
MRLQSAAMRQAPNLLASSHLPLPPYLKLYLINSAQTCKIKITRSLEQLCNELALTNLNVEEFMKEVLQVPDIYVLEKLRPGISLKQLVQWFMIWRWVSANWCLGLRNCYPLTYLDNLWSTRTRV